MRCLVIMTTGKFVENNKAFIPKNTVIIINNGGGSIMLWDYFASSGTGRLQKVDGKIKMAKYLRLPQHCLKPSARLLKQSLKLVVG